MNNGHAAKKQKISPIENDLLTLKNIVEVDGKACTHEVAWPPGMHIATDLFHFLLQFKLINKNTRLQATMALHSLLQHVPDHLPVNTLLKSTHSNKQQSIASKQDTLSLLQLTLLPAKQSLLNMHLPWHSVMELVLSTHLH